jgi:hypothetical protein
MEEMFSARDLEMHDVMIYVDGSSAWSEFHWDFHATLRKDGSARNDARRRDLDLPKRSGTVAARDNQARDNQAVASDVWLVSSHQSKSREERLVPRVVGAWSPLSLSLVTCHSPLSTTLMSYPCSTSR